MLDRALFALAFTAAIGSGLVAGIFFAFSTFVMAALARLPPDQGVAAMQSINITVINPVFMLAFLGTGALCAAAGAGAFVWWGGASGKLAIAAALLYLIGCIGVTMACNVPLNDALAAVTPGTPAAAAEWSRYLGTWTTWNHIRTIASLLAAILFTAAMTWLRAT
jgi:uncharacterized membrane protein